MEQILTQEICRILAETISEKEKRPGFIRPLSEKSVPAGTKKTTFRF